MKSVMGAHGLEHININGELFTGICASNALTIGGTVFPRRDVHKVTWVSPDHRMETQIAISKKWRGSLLDVRNRRGADGASDHHILVGELRLRISTFRRETTQSLSRRYDVSKLESPNTLVSYVGSIITRYDAVSDRNGEEFNSTKPIFTDSSRHLGHTQPKRRVWISDITWQLIEDRRQLKGYINVEQTRASKTTEQAQYTS